MVNSNRGHFPVKEKEPDSRPKRRVHGAFLSPVQLQASSPSPPVREDVQCRYADTEKELDGEVVKLYKGAHRFKKTKNYTRNYCYRNSF